MMKNSPGIDPKFLRTLSLLIVEDDEDGREQICEFLQGKVGTLLSATGGREGLEKFRLHQPQIVLTDILMPDMDGLDLAREIRGLSQDVQIIVLTAFERNDYLLRSIEVGIDKYVLKPVHPEKLQKALLECAKYLQAQEELNRKRERDEEARRSEALRVLAAGMAHDYNNLLNLILGWIGVAIDLAQPGTEIHGSLEKALKVSGKARELGARLVSFAQGKNAGYGTTYLIPVIREAVLHELRETGINSKFSFPADLPPIPLVEAQMTWVFSQITANACQAMPSGGTLHVSAQLRSSPHLKAPPNQPPQFLQITFHDSGNGIPPEILPKIFAPYFSTKQTFSAKGLGLGLAFCRIIIENHRGKIIAESTPGEGAAFHIFLPLRMDLAIPN